MEPRIVPVPLLPLLALVDDVEQVRTCVSDLNITHGPEVWHWKVFLGRFRQEQIPNRGTHRDGELFELFQGGLLPTGFPVVDSRKPQSDLFGRYPSTFSRPGQECRLDRDTDGHRWLRWVPGVRASSASGKRRQRELDM